MNRIFLVEDDETMRALLGTLLSIEGFQVELYSGGNGTGLLEQLRRSLPEVILIDVHLRGENGIDLLRQIRQDPQIMGVRVLMTSGLDMRSECIAAGADGFLMKPYMPEDLIHSLRASPAL